jgi:hypothetical protein
MRTRESKKLWRYKKKNTTFTATLKFTKYMANHLLTFTQGFLYFFGLADNPGKDMLHNMKRKSDAESLLGDWYKVGNDIRSAYEAGKR